MTIKAIVTQESPHPHGSSALSSPPLAVSICFTTNILHQDSDVEKHFP